MNFIKPVIADANDRLEDSATFVNHTITPVDMFFSEHFEIDWRINVVVTTSLSQMLIPEDGVGGRAKASDFIVLAIDQKTTTAHKVAEMLAHELAHAIRWGKNPEWSNNLFCELVLEGLAVHVEAEFAKTRNGENTVFLRTILGRSNEENRKIFDRLRPEFAVENYDYSKIFFDSGMWTRWAGYSAGYYIVGRYLKKTGKSIFEVLDDPYAEFWKMMA